MGFAYVDGDRSQSETAHLIGLHLGGRSTISRTVVDGVHHDADTRPRTDHIDEPVGVVAEAQGGEEQAHGSAREDEHGDRAGPHDLRRAGSEEDASDLAAW